MAAETYVISIYRQREKSGEAITGLAERTTSGERKAFSTSRELWAFLSGNTAPSPAKPRKRQRKKKQP
jgi:hypothetical protein